MNNERYDLMNENEPLPKSVFESYEVFNNSTFRRVGYFIPAVPASPDTTYAIYENKDRLYALVTTDHPSPEHHSNELFKLSGTYKFDSLLTPDGSTKLIPIREDDAMDLDFFIKEDATYYYCANVTEVDKS